MKPTEEPSLPPGYSLDHSDPEVLVLRFSHGTVVARFSVRGAEAKAIEREAWEHYRDHSESA